MTQLIINGLYLPQTSNDNYSCYPTALGTQIEMISGRIVEEVRGVVQVINYSFDCMDNTTYTQLMQHLRSNEPITVVYLPDDSTAMKSSKFLCTAKPMPTFAFDVDGKAVWHNVSFTLREVNPHA